MHRRGHGIGAINKKTLAQAKYKDKGTEIAADQLSQMAKQMESFKGYLEDFAAKHKDQIKKDAEFRVAFQEMCSTIGVDPLASSKGFWAEMLGVGDFYYELGVQVIEVCIATSHRNGGLIDIEELRSRLLASRGKKSQDISVDDLLRAIKKLKVLGNGFTVLPIGTTYLVQSIPGELSMDHTAVLQQSEVRCSWFHCTTNRYNLSSTKYSRELSMDHTAVLQQSEVRCSWFHCTTNRYNLPSTKYSWRTKHGSYSSFTTIRGKIYQWFHCITNRYNLPLVQSIPGELSMDHTAVLQQAESNGFITKTELMSQLKWEDERASRALNFMVKEGLAWVDDQGKERQFWFPSFFPYLKSANNS
ncbi:EAP30 [Mytilus edulis]|uniref:Vacuolar-sorting protein SNF8 n=1 Tax=Mytilus edulis TaxID=6550 RepID=A0A8S3UU91_MYTED|nr:unnamed protein product [Mytilus edulis]CAG2247441.1 EAP30 [Mytilus edulis]